MLVYQQGLQHLRLAIASVEEFVLTQPSLWLQSVSSDVLKMQYECLSCRKENLPLKKQKLQLQIQLLEQQVNVSFASTLNTNFVVAE